MHQYGLVIVASPLSSNMHQLSHPKSYQDDSVQMVQHHLEAAFVQFVFVLVFDGLVQWEISEGFGYDSTDVEEPQLGLDGGFSFVGLFVGYNIWFMYFEFHFFGGNIINEKL